MSRATMYFCERCKREFDAPDVDTFKEWHPEVGGNPFELMEDYSCPMCGSGIISEGYQCPVCGHYSDEFMHDECRVKLMEQIQASVDIVADDDNQLLYALEDVANWYLYG